MTMRWLSGGMGIILWGESPGDTQVRYGEFPVISTDETMITTSCKVTACHHLFPIYQPQISPQWL